MGRVYRHVCDGVEDNLALPAPAGSVAHRTILVQLLDPDPATVMLALGANDGGQPVTNNFEPGANCTVVLDVFYVNTPHPAGTWRAVTDHGGGRGDGGLGWVGTTLEWTLWQFDGTAPGFVGVPFAAGSVVEVWDV